VRCPVQLMAGGADALLGTAPQHALARVLGTACTVLPHVGHDISLEAPEQLAAAVARARREDALAQT